MENQTSDDSQIAAYIRRTNQVLIAYEALSQIMACTFAARGADAADRAYQIASAALAAIGPYRHPDALATRQPPQIEQRSNAGA